MQYCKLNRSEFATIISDMQKERPLALFEYHGQPEYPPDPHELWACWHDKSFSEDPLPAFIVVADDDLTDFLAWAINFIPTFRPITSFFRVLPWSVFLLAKEKRPTNNLHVGSVLVGAILGETLTNATGKGFIASLPLTAFESTYSYAMSRALILGLNQDIMPYITDGWHRARECTEQRARRLRSESLTSLWNVILSLTTNSYGPVDLRHDNRIGIIEEACREIQAGNDLSRYHWRQLSDGRISDSSIAETMRSTKERRVEVFEDVIRKLSGRVLDELYTSFLVGYLASMVSGGSLEHAHLIFPLQNEMPSATLWYGVCAGLPPRNRILTDYNNLGLKILRTLNRAEDLLSTPSGDISLSELEVIFRGTPQSRSFRQAQSTSLRIELAPMVTTVVRWPRSQGGSGQLGLFNGDEQKIYPEQNVLIETNRLSELVTKLRGSLSIAESFFGTKPEPPAKSGAQTRGKRRR